MGYVQSAVTTPVTTRGRLVVRRPPSNLGIVPVVGLATLASKIFKGRGASLPASMAKHQAFILGLATSNPPDLANLRTIANGGTPTKVTPPWNVRVNYGSATGAAKDPNEFPQYRAYAQALLNELTAQAPAGAAPVSNLVTVAPPTLTLAPGPAPVAATVTTPAGPVPVPATIGTRPASLRPRQGSSLLTPAPAIAPNAPAGANTLDTILGAISRLAPGTAPIIRELAPNAPTSSPVNVTVTTPTPGGDAGTPSPSFLEGPMKWPVIIGGGLAAVALVASLSRGRR